MLACELFKMTPNISSFTWPIPELNHFSKQDQSQETTDLYEVIIWAIKLDQLMLNIM